MDVNLEQCVRIVTLADLNMLFDPLGGLVTTGGSAPDLEVSKVG